MKKVLSLLLALALIVSLTACLPADSLEVLEKPTVATEITESSTEAVTLPLIELPTETPTEDVPEHTQPPQGEEIVDPRPHPADVEEQDQQQDRDEQNVSQQQQQRPAEQTPTESTPSNTVATEPAATEPTTQAPTEAPYLDPNGHYTTKNDVALYIHLYGRLPSNYITKSEGNRLYGSYKNIPTSMNIGGDHFGNYQKRLPLGYSYFECDIGTAGGRNRGALRLVFTTSGIVYYTSNHYETFTRLY